MCNYRGFIALFIVATMLVVLYQGNCFINMNINHFCVNECGTCDSIEIVEKVITTFEEVSIQILLIAMVFVLVSTYIVYQYQYLPIAVTPIS